MRKLSIGNRFRFHNFSAVVFYVTARRVVVLSVVWTTADAAIIERTTDDVVGVLVEIPITVDTNIVDVDVDDIVTVNRRESTPVIVAVRIAVVSGNV